MEAATTNARGRRELSGERAQRIIEAMRASVARRGAAGSTFDHVAREAGVSRGLLHYYFGTKEQLLVEVVRRDCEVRLAILDERLGEARTAEDFIALLVFSLEELVRDDPDTMALTFELFTAARGNPEIAAEVADLHKRVREHLAATLAAKQDEGAISLHADAEGVTAALLSLADGLALRMLAEPEHDHTPTLQASELAARALLA
jgi:AcrR family transcriptional regulator